MAQEMPIEACEKCGRQDAVRPKLIATHIILAAGSWIRSDRVMSHEVVDEKRFLTSPFIIGDQFISALYCDRCGIGFIPDSRLSELGIGRRTSR